MDKDNNVKPYERVIYIMCVMMTVLAVALVLVAGGIDKTTNEFQGEAVRRGYADYLPDEHGRPRFKWREPVCERKE